MGVRNAPEWVQKGRTHMASNEEFVEFVKSCVEAFGQSFTEPDDDWQPVAIVQASEGQSAVVPLLTLDKDLWMPLLTKLCAEVKAKRIALVTSAWILRMHKDQYMDPDYVPDAAGIV